MYSGSELSYVIKVIAKHFHENDLDIILVIPPDKQEYDCSKSIIKHNVCTFLFLEDRHFSELKK